MTAHRALRTPLMDGHHARTVPFLEGRAGRLAVILTLTLSAIIATSLAGCSSLPTRGIPHAFDVEVPSPSAVDFVAGAPTKGASPQAVLEGFLRACSAGTSDDFDTARLFLTTTSASRWDPHALIQVYPTDATPLINTEKQGADYAAFLSVPSVASVDQAGYLTESETGHTLQTQFRLVQEDGEWRIDTPDDGIVISAAAFTATYQLSRVFFPMRSGDTLAFDAHWYPKKRLARHLMDALIQGPSEILAPAVTTAIPNDTVLPPLGVEAGDGSVHVSLEATMPASQEAQRLLAWQIFQTLRQSAQVSDVSVTIGGQPLNLSELPSGPKYRMESAIATNDAGTGVVTAGEFLPLPATLSPTRDLPPAGAFPEFTEERWEGIPKPVPTSLLAMSPTSANVVAWLGEGQLYAVDRATKQYSQVAATSASWPSVDRYGWAWSATHSATLALIHPSGISSPLSSVPTLPGTTHIRVSPDGSRAALMRRSGSQVGVWVATIERDNFGVPVALLHPMPLTKLASHVQDISWASPMTLVALQGEGGGESLVITAPLGDFSHGIPAPDGATYLTGGATPLDIYVTDNKGEVWSRSNSLWQPIEAEVRALRYPG